MFIKTMIMMIRYFKSYFFYRDKNSEIDHKIILGI